MKIGLKTINFKLYTQLTTNTVLQRSNIPTLNKCNFASLYKYLL
jgi:hypothetical protein